MAQSLASFALGEVTVRQHNGLFSLNDLHKAAGGELRHRPVEFLRLEQAQALLSELQKGGDSHLFIGTTKGRNGGTYACRELVIAYAAWISAAFHLKVIRVFLAVAAPEATPYSVSPGQTLSAAQADTLRNLLTSQVKKLPKPQQGRAMVQGWSKLKAHFGTDYRRIPAGEFHEAVSIIARHTAEWEVVDEAPKAGTVNEMVADWVDKIEQPNGYPAMLFQPIVDAVQRKLGKQTIDHERIKAAMAEANLTAARVQEHVFNELLHAKGWKLSRWLLSFNLGRDGATPQVREIDNNAFIATPAQLARYLVDPNFLITTQELIAIASACMQRLQGRTPRIAA